MARWRWVVSKLTRQLWFRASLLGILGVVTAIMASVGEHYIPWELPGKFSADSVDSLLTVIASSMLAVTTFSLSVLTSALVAATSSVSPRATVLLGQDRNAQNVLSTFVGAFIYSIVGIIMLKSGAYGERGRIVLFAVTVFVLGLIVVNLLRWIDYLTRFGRMDETSQRIEKAASRALLERAVAPSMKCMSLTSRSPAPEGGLPVMARRASYVQTIDFPALQDIAETKDIRIYINSVPGDFVHHSQPLCVVDCGELDPAIASLIREAFILDSQRSFDQDPRFGIRVLSEVAQRALSSAVNDPGTAIEVIGRQVRLLTRFATTTVEEEEPEYDRVYMPRLEIDDLFNDAFMYIARDGAAMVEVQMRIQYAMRALAALEYPGFADAATRQAELAWARAELALPEPDMNQMVAAFR